MTADARIHRIQEQRAQQSSRAAHGGLRVIGGSTLWRNRWRQRQRQAAGFGALAVLVCLIGVGVARSPLVHTIVLLAGLALASVAGTLLFDGLPYQHAARAMQRVVAHLTQALDDRYTLLRDVTLSDAPTRCDAVLVGPHGVAALEVTTTDGDFLCDGQRWYRYETNGYQRRWEHNPSVQCLQHVHSLRAFLAAHGLGAVPVCGFVVIGGGSITVTGRTTIPIVQRRALAATIQQLPPVPDLPLAQVVDALIL